MAKQWEPVRYSVDSDTMAIEIRAWPDGEGDAGGGYDAGLDLVIHDPPDGRPWLWEIEHASRHPEHIAAAMTPLRRQLLAGCGIIHLRSTSPREKSFAPYARTASSGLEAERSRHCNAIISA